MEVIGSDIVLLKGGYLVGIKPGDVVQLKSGGPKMTVLWLDKDRVVCGWFCSDAAEMKTASIHLVALTPFE